jgi:hypothetical protein
MWKITYILYQTQLLHFMKYVLQDLKFWKPPKKEFGKSQFCTLNSSVPRNVLYNQTSLWIGSTNGNSSKGKRWRSTVTTQETFINRCQRAWRFLSQWVKKHEVVLGIYRFNINSVFVEIRGWLASQFLGLVHYPVF